jgi:CRISPR/Cas system CSM-associated protein Csm3 (group 7 of RAMP superfamily)
VTTDLTIFRARLVQDSALSISGIDSESTSDQPFTRVDGVPVISGRGLKGAAVAMARRCFASLPRSVSEEKNLDAALVRSAWLFEHARPLEAQAAKLPLRAGVGILQETGARAHGVLYDREVVPAGTSWMLELHVDWRLARKIKEDPEEVEGILGYVLKEQWAQGRCWLGGGVARGLGWCHLDLESLAVTRLDRAAYDAWSGSGRRTLPAPEGACPTANPTRAWCFRTRDLTLSFGAYQPEPSKPAWGIDMLAIGAHSQDRTLQVYREGHWVRSRERESAVRDDGTREADTDRAVAMERWTPLLPGSSLRGPLRHAYSRGKRAQGIAVADPHLVKDDQGDPDPAMKLFGTLSESSRLLIRDGHAAEDWLAVRLQQHAEDELTAGSYGSGKRDAVRLLRGSFPVRLVVEGPREDVVAPLLRELDDVIALGALGHLPIGGHKTRGAGWCRWLAAPWTKDDVEPQADPPTRAAVPRREVIDDASPLSRGEAVVRKLEEVAQQARAPIRVSSGRIEKTEKLSLGEAAHLARAAMGEPLVCWWCEPRIDLEVRSAPQTFGRTRWPDGEPLQIDEVVFFAERSSWRAARTAQGWKTVLLEVGAESERLATCREIPALLHGNGRRFDVRFKESGGLTLREWSEGTQVIGYTARGGL